MPQCSQLMGLHRYFCVTHAYRCGHSYGIPASVCVCAYFEFATESTCVGPARIDTPTCVGICTRLYFTCMRFSRCMYLHLCMCLSLCVLHADRQIYLHTYTGIWCACGGISTCDPLCFSIHVDSVPAGPRGPSLHTQATGHAPPTCTHTTHFVHSQPYTSCPRASLSLVGCSREEKCLIQAVGFMAPV